jgi:hypothetical protein
MVLEMLMESVFAVADIYWVAHLKNANAIATVGLTESMLTLIYAVSIGLGIGATATIAWRTGERNPEGAARAAVQVIFLGLMVSAVIGIAGVILAPKLLTLMGGSQWVVEQGVGFTRVMFAGNASIVLLFLINAIFRGGRCRNRNACALAGKSHQHHSRSMFHIWLGSVSGTRRDGSRCGYDDWPEYWRALRVKQVGSFGRKD